MSKATDNKSVSLADMNECKEGTKEEMMAPSKPQRSPRKKIEDRNPNQSQTSRQRRQREKVITETLDAK